MVELEENERDEKCAYVAESEAHLWNKYRTETQNHARRIKDLIALAQDSRLRIDALLGRKSRTRSDLDDTYKQTTTIQRGSIDYEGDDIRRGSRNSEDWNRDYDRRDSRDTERQRHGYDRRESRDSDRGDRTYGRHDSRDLDRDSEHREQTGHIIISTGPGVVEVGSVSLSNQEIDMNTRTHQKTVESNVTHNVSSPGPPAVAKKPGSLSKSPFKFGTVSLQVKLED